MKSIIGTLLMIAGWGFAAWAALVGLGFSGIYLIGFVGTNGREAGKELAFMLGMTIASVTVGYCIGRFGKWLRKANATNQHGQSPN